MPWYFRHCERSEAIHLSTCRAMDCFAALAMTWRELASLHPLTLRRPRSGRLEGRGDRPATISEGMEPGPPAAVTARPASISGSRIPLW